MNHIASFLSIAVVLTATSITIGGQARVMTVSEFIKESDLVAVVDVTKVTQVDVSTGDHQVSRVFVAAAKIQDTLKSDITPTPKDRRIAIVGSTIPRSTAVWRPIKAGRYLAFLNKEQGHYRYGMKYALRPISENNEVEWIEKEESGAWKISNLKLKEAISRIQNLHRSRHGD